MPKEMLYKIKQYGLLRSLVRTLKFLLRKLGITYETFFYFVKNIDEKTEILRPKIEVKIRELNLSDIVNANLMKFESQKLQLFKNRFEQGTFIALGAFNNGNLIYLCWISLKDFEISINPKILKLNKDEGLLLDAFCHPNYRGLGLHSLMNIIRINKIHELGKKKVVAVVLKENSSAIKVQLKSGLKKSKIIKYIKILNWEKIIIRHYKKYRRIEPKHGN